MIAGTFQAYDFTASHLFWACTLGVRAHLFIAVTFVGTSEALSKILGVRQGHVNDVGPPRASPL